MADFFAVVELLKYYILDNDMLVSTNAFTYAAKLKTDTILDSYFTTLYGAIDNTGKKEILLIKGITVNYTVPYTLQTSIVDCEDSEESFYFDIATQTIYIHINHNLNPYSCIIEYGRVFGFTNDKVRNFNGSNYLPLIKSLPTFRLKVDPLKYTKQSFFGGNIVFKNVPIDGSDNGDFDSNQEFTGNDVFIYIGEDGDAYNDLYLVTNNYIENTKISMDEVIVITKDKREQQSVPIPTATFSSTDFPDIDEDLEGEIIPIAYGFLHMVPGICVNSNNSGNKKFYFSIISYPGIPIPAPVFRVLSDEKWEAIVPTVTDYANGFATFAIADIHVDGDNTKGIKQVSCTANFDDILLAPAVIADLNDKYLNITYNASNYNLAEWNAETLNLANTGIYINEQKDLWKWIEKLQNASTVGFQYFFDNGVRTIRLDNPNRNPVKTIYAVEILNELKFDNNDDEYATNAVIEYNRSYTTDRTAKFENGTYFNEVMRKHRKSKQYESEVLSSNIGIAENKSIIIMEDLQKERLTGKILVHGKEFFSLRLFDIINVECSKPGIKTGQEVNDLYIHTDDPADDLYIHTDDPADDYYIHVDWLQRDIVINYREFLGWQRFQIIGLQPNFNTGNVQIEVRQRDYSDLFADITGFTP
jgi:hypothetical protein